MAAVVDGFGGRVLLGAFLAFVIATLVSFVGNALWSFGARLTPAKAAMFFAVNTVGLLLNMLIAWLLERAGVHYLLISLTVLVVVPMFNFAGHRLITFARPG
jgi:putative flippase GtrA